MLPARQKWVGRRWTRGGPAEEENSSNGSNDDEDKDEERGRGG